MTSRFLLLLTLAFSANVFADIEVCGRIDEPTVLAQDWIVSCKNGIEFAPGVKIVTHEHAIIIRSNGTMKNGTPENGAVFRCLDENDTYNMGDKACGEIKIQVATLDGALDVDCTAPGMASCQVGIATASYTDKYRQSLKSGLGGSAKFWRNGVEDNTNVRTTN